MTCIYQLVCFFTFAAFYIYFHTWLHFKKWINRNATCCTPRIWWKMAILCCCHSIWFRSLYMMFIHDVSLFLLAMSQYGVKEHHVDFFYRFFRKIFWVSVFFIIFADIKENGNPPLTSSTLIGGGLFAFYTPVKGNDIGINYCFFEIGKTHANQDIRDEE